MPFAAPTPAQLKARYPAFAAVEDATIQYWLTDAERFVDQTWIEADYQPAIMAYAAHYLAKQGYDAGAGTGALPAGVTRFRSGSMDISVAESVASAQASGGWAATPYGQEFAALRRRSLGGPRLAQACIAVCP